MGAMRLKASTFRSYIHVLARERKTSAVLALVPPATAAVIEAPPLAGTWVDFQHIIDITVAVETLGGMVGVRDFTKKATADARKPYMGVVEGVLKLFGTSPATLFKRMNDLVKSTLEGLDYAYTATSERSGTMELTYQLSQEVPTCMFVGAVPALQILLDTCGVEGVIGPPVRLGPNKVRFTIQW
jgi:hypothetical protein